MSSPSGQPAPVTPPPAPKVPLPSPSSQRRDAPLPPTPDQEPASSVGIGGPPTTQQGATALTGTIDGATAPGTSAGTTSAGATVPESTTPDGTPPTALPDLAAAPSPSKPVAGQKHRVRQLEDFINKKSTKTAAGSSAQPLLLKATPKKKRIGPVDERPVAGASKFLYQPLRTARSGSDLEQRAHGRGASARPTRALRLPRASSAVPSQPVHSGYPNTPQVAQQQAMPQQQLMHQQIIPHQVLFQQQAMAQQQLFQQPHMPQQQLVQQQPQMYQPFMQVPAPMAYAMPMQTPNPAMGYHGFPQPAPILNAGPSMWNNYREAHQGDSVDQRYSTPRRARTRHVHYDLDEDEDEDDDYKNDGGAEDGDDEEEADDENDKMEYEHQYDLDDADLEDEDQEEHEEEEKPMAETVQDDEMEDIDEHDPEAAQLGAQALPPGTRESETLRPEPSQSPRDEMEVASGRISGRRQSLSHGLDDDDDDDERPSRRKGKEHATGLVTPWGERALPPQGGEGYFLLLLQQFNEFNELQREENRLNRQWQQNMTQYVKKLDHKITRGPAGVVRGTNGRSSGSRVKVHRDRPSNSMASRIILEPRDQPMSPEDLKRLEEKEKGHLADLQNVVRVHFKKLLSVASYKEMAKKNPPLNDDKIFEYEASGSQYFTADNFRVDFVQAWKEFPFNLSARDFFASHLVRVLKGGGYRKAAIPPRYHTYDHVAEALDIHMDHARKRYREAVDPPNTDEIEKSKRKARMVSRRGTLYTSRFRVTKHVEKYNRYQDIFVNLRGAHMSADETDHDDNSEKKHPPTFTIIRAAWMSYAFRRLCRELDNENIKNRGVLIGDQGSGGNGPRVREDTRPAQEAETRAPVGLWRNCYDTVWLTCLKDDQICRLDIIDEDFDLTLPKDTDDHNDDHNDDDEAT